MSLEKCFKAINKPDRQTKTLKWYCICNIDILCHLLLLIFVSAMFFGFLNSITVKDIGCHMNRIINIQNIIIVHRDSPSYIFEPGASSTHLHKHIVTALHSLDNEKCVKLLKKFLPFFTDISRQSKPGQHCWNLKYKPPLKVEVYPLSIKCPDNIKTISREPSCNTVYKMTLPIYGTHLKDQY